MTLDARARRAAHRFRLAVEELDRATPGDPMDRFERYRRQRQRTQRAGVIVVAASLTIVVGLLVSRAFTRTERPLGPQVHNGRIVFGRSVPGVDEVRLFAINPDGSDEVALPTSFTDCAEWSPDGTRLHVTASEYPGSPLRPAVIAADGNGFTLLDGARDQALDLGCGDWTPDGRRLVLEGLGSVPSAVNGIYSVRTSDGGDLVRITRSPLGGSDSVPQVSPDGSRIAFLRSDPQRHVDADSGAVFVVRADGTHLRRLTPWGAASSSGSWSPDGRWLAFSGPPNALYLVHPDGIGLRRIPVDAGPGQPLQPRWSPDGSELVFGVRTDGQGDIYTVRLDGSDLSQLTNTPNVDERWPDWGSYRGVPGPPR